MILIFKNKTFIKHIIICRFLSELTGVITLHKQNWVYNSSFILMEEANLKKSSHSNFSNIKQTNPLLYFSPTSSFAVIS